MNLFNKINLLLIVVAAVAVIIAAVGGSGVGAVVVSYITFRHWLPTDNSTIALSKAVRREATSMWISSNDIRYLANPDAPTLSNTNTNIINGSSNSKSGISRINNDKVGKLQ